MMWLVTVGIDEEAVIIDYCPIFAKESNAATRSFIEGLVETLSSINRRFQLPWSTQLLLKAKYHVLRTKQEVEGAVYQQFAVKLCFP